MALLILDQKGHECVAMKKVSLLEQIHATRLCSFKKVISQGAQDICSLLSRTIDMVGDRSKPSGWLTSNTMLSNTGGCRFESWCRSMHSKECPIGDDVKIHFRGLIEFHN